MGYIDSLKGFSTLAVFACHWSCVFLIGLFAQQEADTMLELVWQNTPLNIITNGNFGVQFFFVASAFLITGQVYKNKNIDLRYILKKYTVAAWIIIPAILFAFVLMRLGMMYHVDAMNINPKMWILSSYYMFEPTARSVATDIFKTFFESSFYVGPLWTMHYEILGSIAVAVFSYINFNCNRTTWKRRLGYVILFLPLSKGDLQFSAFLIGALAYDLIYGQNAERTQYNNPIALSKKVKLLILIISVYLMTINLFTTGWWNWLSPFASYNLFFRVAGLGGFLYVLADSPKLQKKIDCRGLRFIEVKSPYIYALHWPILFSLGCFLYVQFYELLPYKILVVLIGIICFIFSFIIGEIILLLKNKIILCYGKIISKGESTR